VHGEIISMCQSLYHIYVLTQQPSIFTSLSNLFKQNIILPTYHLSSREIKPSPPQTTTPTTGRLGTNASKSNSCAPITCATSHRICSIPPLRSSKRT
jgi:hypothetical protein